MSKKHLTTEEQLKKYKRKYRTVFSILLAFIAMAGFYIYLNYDYLAFKHFISQNYIYTQTLDDMYKKELKLDVRGRYYTYFDDLVISVMTKYIRETNNDVYTYLFIPEYLKKYKEEEKKDALQSEIKTLNNKTVYLHLTNFSKYTQKFMIDNQDKFKGYPFLIIDLRDNYGGDINVMARISDMFLPRGSIIATDRMRIFDRVLKARNNDMLEFEKIIILQGRDTASASENLIAALKDNLDNVILIGDTTFGKGIGQFTLPLKRSYAVKATVLLWYTPKNVNIQGKGIKPDIPYTGNDIIGFALTKLANK